MSDHYDPEKHHEQYQKEIYDDIQEATLAVVEAERLCTKAMLAIGRAERRFAHYMSAQAEGVVS